MTVAELETLIVDACDGTEWHLSLWYPRVAREVLGIPRSIADSEVQACLFRLIAEGRLEAGSVEGSEFSVTRFEVPTGRCPDLYVRAAMPVAVE